MPYKKYIGDECVKRSRIIYNILGCADHTETQNKQVKQDRQNRQVLEFIGDAVGALSLFASLFVGLFFAGIYS
jgi:hypothetical protein